MKKILLPFLCVLFFESQATTWNVTVSNFQFSTPNLNVKVGDIIHWVWSSGSHTTTSISVPSGAASWDASITSSSSTFDYAVTKAGPYSYVCSIHPQMTGTFTATTITPVVLSNFNITSANGKASISWSTQTELNSDHFSIRKSLDGNNFKEIAQIPAAGNSSLQKDYSFTDDKISSSIRYVYYALAIVDKDGQTQLSPIKIFKNKSAVTKLIISLSPNPVSGMGHLMLKFNADKPGTMHAKMIDTQGKLVLETDLSAVTGVNSGHIHLGGISNGTYTFQFTLDGVTESYRIIRN